MSHRSLLFSMSALVLMAAIVGIGFTQTQGPPTVASTSPGGQPACCYASGSTQSLSGVWLREFDGTTITATLGGDELKLCISQKTGSGVQSVTFIADYTLTRDGLVHGVITGVDFTSSPEATSAGSTTSGRKMMTLHGLVDHPFSFRTHMTSAGTMVSNVKFAMEDMDLKEIINQFCGMYKREVEVPKELNKNITPAAASVVEVSEAKPAVVTLPALPVNALPATGLRLATELKFEEKTPRLISLKECFEIVLKSKVSFGPQPGSQFERDLKVNHVLVNIDVTYWNLLAAQENLHACEEGLRRAHLAYRFAQTRVESGSDPKENLGQAQAHFEKFRRRVIDARAEVLQADRKLRGFLGLPAEDGAVLVPSDQPTISAVVPDFQQAVKEALAHRPEILECHRACDFNDFVTCIAGLESCTSSKSTPIDEILRRRSALLNNHRRETESKVIEDVTQQYRQVIQTHADITPARAERESLQIYLLRIDSLIACGKWNPQDFQNYLAAQQQLATAIATEHQAIADYNIALAAFEFAKGTIQQYRHVAKVDVEKPGEKECEPAPMPREVDGRNLR